MNTGHSLSSTAQKTHGKPEKRRMAGKYVIHAGLLLAITLLGSSCATSTTLEGLSDDPAYTHTSFTSRLWDITSEADGIIEIPYSKMPESALIEDGHVYTKNEKKQLYYIHRTPDKETKDLTLRVAATPIALAADICLEGLFIMIYALGSMSA